ncbi:MAG: helix-turn-helix transcriptional regulator [Actinomycetia bacterium]|nr:helix-turn-helix transcriptional regulator [Actinomycetes bacterium]
MGEPVTTPFSSPIQDGPTLAHMGVGTAVVAGHARGTDLDFAGVAPSAGFCDQAELTRQFARSRSEIPARFRRRRCTQTANPKARIDP